MTAATQPVAAPELILVLNCAEGFLQMVIGVSPDAGRQAEQPPRRLRASVLQGILCSQEWRLPSQSVELLMPLVTAALNTIHLTPSSIRRIACVTGPGSFTGIRLAISTAAGLARATGATTAAIPFLPLLANNVLQSGIPAQTEAETLWAVTHARRDLVHMQGFTATSPEEELVPLGEVMVLSPVQAAQLIASTKKKALLFGSGATRNRTVFDNALAMLHSRATILPGAFFDTPQSSTLFAAACNARFSTSDISPHYVRPCDAEESLEHIAASLGLNPQTARSALDALQTGGISSAS